MRRSTRDGSHAHIRMHNELSLDSAYRIVYVIYMLLFREYILLTFAVSKCSLVLVDVVYYSLVFQIILIYKSNKYFSFIILSSSKVEYLVNIGICSISQIHCQVHKLGFNGHVGTSVSVR